MVLLDEPFSNLDSTMRQRLRLEVETILRSQRTAAVFVTHDREEAFAIADRVGVMIDGKLLQIDTPERIYHFPVSEKVAQLTGSCDFIEGRARGDGRVETELGSLRCDATVGSPVSRTGGDRSHSSRRRGADSGSSRAGDSHVPRVQG